MWPWEHVIVAYLLYSIARHATTRSGPTGPETLVLGVAAILPDLIDKPLSWQFGLFEPSYGPAHSIIVATALCMIVLVISWVTNRGMLGIAFGVGYLTHLATDVFVLYPGGIRYEPTRVLWPFLTPEAGRDHASFVDALTHYLGLYIAEVRAGEHHLEIAVYLLIMLVGIGLWVRDGTPGWRLLIEKITG